MGRTNLDPILTFPDGSHLLISTACSKEGRFSCALYWQPLKPMTEGPSASSPATWTQPPAWWRKKTRTTTLNASTPAQLTR